MAESHLPECTRTYIQHEATDEPWKREARGEEPAVAPAAVAQRPRGAKAVSERRACRRKGMSRR